MSKVLKSLAALSVTVSLMACAADNNQEAEQVEPNVEQTTPKKPTKHAPIRKSDKTMKSIDKTPPPQELSKGEVALTWHTGSFKFIGLEGGFIGFIGENGQKLMPLGLEPRFQINGAKVKILGHIDNDIMTIQQWGTPFRVKKVIIIDKGNAEPINNNTTY